MNLARMVGVKVTKRFGNVAALRGVSFQIERGRPCLLLGANGAGKSTLMNIGSTLSKESSGSLYFEDTEGKQVEHGLVRASIGVISHESMLYPDLTAAQNLQFFAQLYGVSFSAEEMLKEVGLEETAWKRPVKEFSRGMTQRVSIAKALLHNPQVLLFDEPFSGIDRGGAQLITDAIGKAKERGAIALVTSHEFDVLGDLFAQVLVLRRGKLVHEMTGSFSPSQLRQCYDEFAQ